MRPTLCTLLGLSAALSLSLPGALIAQQSSLATIPIEVGNSNNSGRIGGGVYFDTTVNTGIRITAFDCNFPNAAGTAGSIDVYTIPGTSVGNESTSTGWTLVGTATLTAAGDDTPTRCEFATPFTLAPGSYGIAICTSGVQHTYTNGTATNTSFANADLSLTLGSATNVCFSGTAFTPRVWNGVIYYTPDTGTFATFETDVVSGPSPLNVQFTDTSFDSGGAAIGWIWDFGDGTATSNAQNPQHSYSTCGTFDVTLTVIGPGGTGNVTKTGLIVVDPITADFTTSPGAGPTDVAFSDASTGPLGATTWQWDFDSDGTVDSTLQNPTHTYPAEGFYTCTLTVGNGCNTETIAKRASTYDVLGTPDLTVNSGLGGGDGVISMDLVVTNPAGITVRGVDFGALRPSNIWVGRGFLEVYLASDAGTGNHTDPTAWRLVASSQDITVGGQNQGGPSFVDVPDFYLAQGSYGFAFLSDLSHSYNNTGAQGVLQNADLTITSGTATVQPPFGSTNVFSPRQWVGALYYEVGGAGPFTFMGDGCVDAAGNHTEQVLVNPPKINANFTVDMPNLAGSTLGVLYIVGLGNQTFNGLPLPADLGLFGLPGCQGRVEPLITRLVGNTGGTATVNVMVPNNPAFLGQKFFTQGLGIDGGLPGGGYTTDAGAGVIGS